MERLSELVKSQIEEFLCSDKRVAFRNELDFQIQLAHHLLCSEKFTKVFMEYYIPQDMIKDYPWESQIYTDIVVELNSKFYLIELKYKTKSIPKIEYTCFGRKYSTSLLKNQGARDHACYDFWRDVKRIECIQNSFPDSVSGGVAIFLTNDSSYESGKVLPESDHVEFSLNPNTEFNPQKCWRNPENKKGRTSEIHLRENYERKWERVSWSVTAESEMRENFFYCIVEIGSEYKKQ